MNTNCHAGQSKVKMDGVGDGGEEGCYILCLKFLRHCKCLKCTVVC